MASIHSEIHNSSLEADLVDDLVFPLERVRLEGQMGLWTLAALGEKLAGRDGASQLSEARHAKKLASACRFVFSLGDFSGLLDKVAALAPENLGFSAPLAIDHPEVCRAGAEFAWQVFSEESACSIFGLPGFRLEGGSLRWMPPHPGRYAGVVVACTERGFAFRHFELVCR